VPGIGRLTRHGIRSTGLAVLILGLALGLWGCAGPGGDGSLASGDLSPRHLYRKARAELQQRNYGQAIQLLQELMTRFGDQPEAEAARLSLAYAYYKAGEHQQAIDTAVAFIHRHPQNANVAYAYYVRGLAAYARSKRDVEQALAGPPSPDALASTREAFRYLSELVERFPRSRYFNDAMTRIVKLRNRMARYQVHAAEYDLEAGNVERAVERARYVQKHFARTRSLPAALAVLARGQLVLGRRREAEEVLAALEANYPDDPVTTATREYFSTHRGVGPAR